MPGLLQRRQVLEHTVFKGVRMKIFRKLKKAGVLCLTGAVLFLCAGDGYLLAKGTRTAKEDVNWEETGVQLQSEGLTEADTQLESEKNTEADTQPESEKDTEADTQPESERSTEADTRPESEKDTEADTRPENGKDTETDIPTENEKDTEVDSEPESEKNTETDTQPESEKPVEADQQPESTAGAEQNPDLETGGASGRGNGAGTGQFPAGETELMTGSGMQKELNAGKDDGSEPGTEEETEQMTETFVPEEIWQDCAYRKSGSRAMAKAANPVVKRDNDLIMTYLGYPCYFKYVTKHGMNTGGRTVAAYCVYNTLEAPEKEDYKPSGSGAFSKEITYCLYNGCRYRGETAYNPAYSTGDWKKDYYITQIAIHMINFQQGRESSIESQLDASADKKVYRLVEQMINDAYTDKVLIESGSNQSQEVSFTVQPVMQEEWVQQGDGTWRTASDYVCESSCPDRLVSVTKTLEGAPAGVSLVETSPGSPLSAFYFTATDDAYRSIVREGLTVNAVLTVTAQEYGGWWYEPADNKVKRQYITYLALEALTKSAQPRVSAMASELQFEVHLVKKDAQTGNVLKGAVYGLYRDAACTLPAGSFPPTGTDGKTSITGLAADQDVYYVKEITPPPGYCADGTVYPVSALQPTAALELWDRAQMAELILKKTDRDTKTARPQGDAVLEGAKYGLYAREDILHPDGVTGTVLAKDAQAATLITDGKGMASVSNLYPGRYYLKEIEAPKGYVRDEQEHEIYLPYEGGASASVQREITLEEQVKKQAFQLIKGSDQGDAQPEALKGAGFSAWLLSDLDKKPDGSYDTAGAAPAVIGANGETELFTDAAGYLRTVPLPYGTYLVRETTVPYGHKPVGDFYVTISEHSPEIPQPWKILLDESFMARLKIVKKDAGSGSTIRIPGAEFTVTDLETGERIVQETSYPSKEKHDSFFTNEEGFLLLPEELPPGKYRIEEVAAPEGYLLSKNAIDVEIAPDKAYQTDTASGEVIVEIVCEDIPVTGRIAVKKTGRMPEAFEEDFLYDEKAMEGVVFEVVAGEDVLSPDGQAGGEGHKVLYQKGTVVDEIVTDEHGYGSVDGLPLGTYLLREKQAPFGFIKDADGIEAVLAYVDGQTPVVEWEKEIENVRQQLEVEVIKTDRESGKPLKGAKFSLYAKEAIRDGDGAEIVPAGARLGDCTTDENGEGAFSLRLPHGLYLVKEESAPQGYVEESAVQEVDLRGCDGVTKTVRKEVFFGNDSTLTEISKQDITGGDEIEGAYLEIRDDEGRLVEQWISGKEPHRIRGLIPGKTYTLTETQAPAGYVISESISFQVENTKEVQKIVMKDARVMGKVRIRKTDRENGGPLKGAVFGLYSEQGELLERLKTDKSGTAGSALYEIGTYEGGRMSREITYTVKEIAPPRGYQTDEDEYPVTFSYQDGTTPVIEVELELTNEEETETETQSEPEPPQTGGPPRTGDSTDAGLAAVAAAVSAVLFGIGLFLKKRMSDSSAK